ncbi:gamma-glutamyltranspeptidase/glutathione hydrolase [Catalinimonas alkaloidigena]|uniref:gamma-glutamyltransferase n=1 Tax=Catalinimonas alkaloidigena TaxID=1075417 RepID=UPI0024075964|nr:gamma-glutamyltransferase [Catalinimonas alkaloidigena]MDF9798506.1 gamma-glutamyltranspeptidase/glutathione hydrolase [Catalinimonas alkaloidigena]
MRIICFLLVLLCFITFTTYAQDRSSGKAFATRSEVLARNGMLATNHPLATQIGIDILKQGGSAIDAAIAANAFLGFADPGMNGIGGDLFAIVWDAETQQLYGINGSGRSVQNMTREYLLAQQEKGTPHHTGILSVTTPGCVDAWFALNERFGKLPMSTLLQPTIAYAREGIPITQEVADNMKDMEESVINSDHENFKALFFTDGHFPRKGDMFKNPDLANTLSLISEQGRDAYYKGEIAEKIEAHMKKRGGFLTREDLAAHESEWVEPVSVNYRGYDVWELPPNGQGMGALQMLSILEGFDIGSFGYGSAAHIHHFLEAKKLAYEDMVRYYGDPDFGDIPIEELLSEEYAAQRRALIDPDKAGVYHPGLQSGDHTIYLTAADKEGNMISFIQSNSALFGSLEVVKGLGFPLQNRGGGFILEEGHINTYAPGKRPFHTIIPAFVTKDGEPFMSFGVMGGDMQTQGHVQILMNVLDFGMNLQEAGDAPRIYHRGSIWYDGHSDNVGDTYLESGFDYEVLSELMKKGHNIRMARGIFGGYQAIMFKGGVYYGASESRKDGQAAGY